MPKTIVLNTLTGAVSEYDNYPFQSITPTHAGATAGLFLMGGDTDAGQPIISSIQTGKTHWGSTLKKLLGAVYFSMKGEGNSELTVVGENASYSYSFPVRDTGESRCTTGKGIRENYLAFRYRNTDGADFALDRIEVPSSTSKTRRV